MHLKQNNRKKKGLRSSVILLLPFRFELVFSVFLSPSEIHCKIRSGVSTRLKLSPSSFQRCMIIIGKSFRNAQIAPARNSEKSQLVAEIYYFLYKYKYDFLGSSAAISESRRALD